jgi:hypothetical protein
MQTASSPSDVHAWFSAHEAQRFDLVIAGQVFGGRHGEAPQCLQSALLTPNGLRVQFDSTEVLSITTPAGILLEPQALSVRSADEVVFGWHCYGREQTPENWCELRYTFSGNRVRVQSSGPASVRAESFAFTGTHAVMLVRDGQSLHRGEPRSSTMTSEHSMSKTPGAGDRLRLSGGYDMEPEWLGGQRYVEGVITRFIPGQNEAAAAVVKLDEPLRSGTATGEYLVLELRYVGAGWTDTQTVHVELCDFEPEAKAWQQRKQGKWVESHATCIRI